jgi:hypothetical protein
VGSDFDEQPLTFVTTADLFNGFGANFVHLPSPTAILAQGSYWQAKIVPTEQRRFGRIRQGGEGNCGRKAR